MGYISTKKVLPEGPIDAEILYIGEAPGYDEDKEGRPFAGSAGEELNRFLGSAGLSRQQLRITNVCNYRPADNNFEYLIDSPQLKEGLQEIRTYIASRKPKIVVLAGEKPLNFLLGRRGITKWRGSFVEKDGQLYYCTLHPAYIGYNRNEYPIACFDFKRLKNALDYGYSFPKHDFIIDPRGLELQKAIEEIRAAPVIAIDIETPKANPYHILCCGFATSTTRAYCIVNHSYNGMEPSFERALRSIIEEGNEKQIQIYHNGYAFDTISLSKNDIKTKISHDTIIAAHSLNPEFALSLAFLTSICTEEPFYKSMISDSEDVDTKGWNDKVPKNILYDYNCRDGISTFGVYLKQLEEFENEPECFATFEYEMSLVPLSNHISNTGMLVDVERRTKLLDYVNMEIAKRQQLLNAICGRAVNPNGRIVLHDVLFNQFKLPIRKSRKGEITADEDAIVSLISVTKIKADESKMPATKFEWEKKWAALKLILILRGLLKLKSSYLEYNFNDDGRVRSMYKMLTISARWSSSKYIDHSGLNAQTFPRESLEIL